MKKAVKKGRMMTIEEAVAEVRGATAKILKAKKKGPAPKGRRSAAPTNKPFQGTKK